MSQYERQPSKQMKLSTMSPSRDSDDDVQDDSEDDNQIDLENLDPDQIQDLINRQAQNEEVGFDSEILVKSISALAQKKRKNEEMRAQFVGKPDKYVESEVELDAAISKLTSLSAYPELLPEFTESSGPKQLIELLLHENTDIAIEVTNFFHEIFTVDLDANNLQTILKLQAKAASLKLFSALVQNLNRFDENSNDDYDAVHKILGIIESMLELKPEYGKELCEEAGFFKWAIRRFSREFKLAARVIDDNRLYLSEIMPLLLTDAKNQQAFAKLKGIDAILAYLATYEKTDPTCEEESETVLNFVDSLCLLLVKKEYQDVFFSSRGIERMLQLISGKKEASRYAIRILSYALVNSADNCNAFVDQQGLKYAFPILIKKGIKAKKQEDQQKIDEQITGIIKNILKEATVIQQDRVLNKFREDLSKVERLFEMHKQYNDRMKQIEVKIKDPTYLATLEEFQDEDADLGEALYEKKLEEGLSVLENVDFIIAFLLQGRDATVAAKAKKGIKGEGVREEIQKVLEENLKQMDGSAQRDQELIKKILNAL